MKKGLLIIVILNLLFYLQMGFGASQKTSVCTEGPKVIKPMNDYTIVAGNTTSIDSSSAFNKTVTYSVQAKPTNSENKVTINPKSGKITVHAEAEDKFDVKVVAKNTCGSATTTFNIEIDEEH